MTHDITRHRLLLLAEERGVDPSAAERCIIGPGRDPWRILVDDEHPAYPRTQAEPVPPANSWPGLHEILRRKDADVYAVLARVYGLTLGIKSDGHVRHQQWADALTADPFRWKSREAWGVRQNNRVNTRLRKPTYTVAQAHKAIDEQPIDLVYTWVDGSDPVWRAKYQEVTGRTPPDGRCTDAGELAASLRSADRFAPWIRNIFIVSDGQTPACATNHPRVRVIDHKQIITEKYLPLFNSHAIEQWLHRMPGLADRFIYANDDMMFGNTVTPDQFFTRDGRALVRFDGLARRGDGVHNQACGNAADLLDKTFGVRPWRRSWHHMTGLRKAMLAEIAAGELADDVRRSTRRRIRSGNNLPWHVGFWAEYSIATGYGVEAKPGQLVSRYVGMDTDGEQASMDAAVKQRPHLLCVNNVTPASAERLQAFVDRYYGAADELTTAGRKFFATV